MMQDYTMMESNKKKMWNITKIMMLLNLSKDTFLKSLVKI